MLAHSSEDERIMYYTMHYENEHAAVGLMEGLSEIFEESALQVLFNFDGKALSLKDKRNLYDHNKQLIVNMTQKVSFFLLTCLDNPTLSPSEYQSSAPPDHFLTQSM